MADDHDCGSSGPDKGLSGVGQVTRFLSVTWSFLIGRFRNLSRFLSATWWLLIGSFRNVFRFLSAIWSLLIGRFRNLFRFCDPDFLSAAQELRNPELQDENLFQSRNPGFPSAAQELRNELLQNDATTSSIGEQTYYSTAPRELWAEPLSHDLQDVTTSSLCFSFYSTAPQDLWTELLLKDVQDGSFVGETKNNEGQSSGVAEIKNNEVESSCVEVLMLEPSDFVVGEELAEGGQALLYFAKCPKLRMPVVVKRLKDLNVDLFALHRRMEEVMKVTKRNNSPICRVLGVGKDKDGYVCVVMERMVGDLRTFIDKRSKQPAFADSESILIMLDIARGMEDLHNCKVIHADLKASNILLYVVELEDKNFRYHPGGSQYTPVLFRAKIGDFDTSDRIWGTGFWRAPEVLEALKSKGKPNLSPSADVYSYGMLCYELLTGRIPLDTCARSDYSVILSGRRPKLPDNMNPNLKELIRACWQTDPERRPGWKTIIEHLKSEYWLDPVTEDDSTPECKIQTMRL